MGNIVVPLVILIVTVVGGLIALRHLNAGTKKPASSEEISIQTAQEFINIKDIDEHFLYTNDGLAIIFLRVEGIIIDLLSKTEQESLVRQLAADFSDISFPFKHISISRPVDISPTLLYWNEQLDETDDDIRKMLLKNEIRYLGNIALSAHIIERQHYISFWDRYDETHELMKNANIFVERFDQNNIKAHILKNAEIVRLVNLVNNPNYVHLEDTDYEATIPIIESLF